MDGLSPETRELLARARDGVLMPAARRRALRAHLAVALGLPGPRTVHSAAAWPRGATWLARVFGSLGIVGAVGIAALASRAAFVQSESKVPSTVAVAAAKPVTASPSLPPPDVPSVPTPRDADSVMPSKPSSSGGPSPNAGAAAIPHSHGAPVAVEHLGHAPEATLRNEDLAAEAHLVADAQTAFAQGHFDQTLARLKEHDRRFPAGALAPESGVLRVAALCASGRSDEARAAAEGLRERFPLALRSSSCTDP
jgi:hypothetical protein